MHVHLRGTNGSGKSTAVRRLLIDHNGELVEEREFMRGSKGEKIKLWRCDGDLYVLGSYNLDEATAPGVGADHINGPFGVEVVHHYAARCPHLLWESARGSAEHLKDDLQPLGIVWALMDTTADDCIAGVYERRRATGRNQGRPLNEKKIRENHALANRAAMRAMESGNPVVTINRDHAANQLQDLLAFGGWRPKRTHPPRWDWGAVLPSTTRRN
jgi:hypothetical protein